MKHLFFEGDLYFWKKYIFLSFFSSLLLKQAQVISIAHDLIKATTIRVILFWQRIQL
jgi:hypothetical protein